MGGGGVAPVQQCSAASALLRRESDCIAGRLSATAPCAAPGLRSYPRIGRIPPLEKNLMWLPQEPSRRGGGNVKRVHGYE